MDGRVKDTKVLIDRLLRTKQQYIEKRIQYTLNVNIHINYRYHVPQLTLDSG